MFKAGAPTSPVPPPSLLAIHGLGGCLNEVPPLTGGLEPQKWVLTLQSLAGHRGEGG